MEDVRKNVEDARKYVREHILDGQRLARNDGLAQGVELSKQIVLESLRISLGIRFGNRGLLLLPAVSEITFPEDIVAFQRKLKTAQSVEELESWCRDNRLCF